MNKFYNRRSVRMRQRGFSLLETMVACAVLLIGITGLMSLFTIAALRNANQGADATRTTEYAQDKMEQLMTVPFIDTTADTTTNPTCMPLRSLCTPTIAGQTNTGLGGNALGATYGGTNPWIDPAHAVAGYVDYIDIYGNYNLTSAGAQYVRQWKIVDDSSAGGPNVKTITVSVSSLKVIGMTNGTTNGISPNTVLISQKTNF